MVTYKDKERVLNVLSHFLDIKGVKFEYCYNWIYKAKRYKFVAYEPYLELSNGLGKIWCVINEATSQSKVYLTDNSGDKILYSTDDFVKMTDFVIGLPDLLNSTGGGQ